MTKLVRMSACCHEPAPVCRAAVSARRGRLGVPAAAGGAYERGIGTTIRNHSEDAVSAREASAGYPPDAERGGRGEAEQARTARRRAKAKGRRAVRCISNRSNEAAGVYGLEPAPLADGCPAPYDMGIHAAR